jgi:shikimate kinase
VNLVLIGYRGTGKSSLANLLGERLARPVVSLDERLVQRAGRSIPEFVAEHGWPAFRDLEQELCAEHARHDGLVLDCGGGIVERPANVGALRANGRLVWLRAEIPTIVERIRHGTERPSLTAAGSFIDEVAEVLGRRTPLYRAAAHLEVVTDARAVTEIAAEVTEWFSREEGYGRPTGQR